MTFLAVQKTISQLYRRNVPLLHTSRYVTACDQFQQAFPRVSTASDKRWVEKAWIRGYRIAMLSVATFICCVGAICLQYSHDGFRHIFIVLLEFKLQYSCNYCQYFKRQTLGSEGLGMRLGQPCRVQQHSLQYSHIYSLSYWNLSYTIHVPIAEFNMLCRVCRVHSYLRYWINKECLSEQVDHPKLWDDAEATQFRLNQPQIFGRQCSAVNAITRHKTLTQKKNVNHSALL